MGVLRARNPQDCGEGRSDVRTYVVTCSSILFGLESVFQQRTNVKLVVFWPPPEQNIWPAGPTGQCVEVKPTTQNCPAADFGSGKRAQTDILAAGQLFHVPVKWFLDLISSGF